MKKQSKIIYVLTLVMILLSCRSAEYHKEKFFKKGGTFECVPEVVPRVDTLILENGDTVFKTTYDTVYKPKIEYITKWKERFDNKRFKDSLKIAKKMYRDSLFYDFKNKKSENKKEIKINKTNKKSQVKINRSNNKKDIKKSRNIYLFFLIYFLGVVTIPIVKFILKRSGYGKKSVSRE